MLIKKFDTGYSILDAGFPMPDIVFSMLGVRFSKEDHETGIHSPTNE